MAGKRTEDEPKTRIELSIRGIEAAIFDLDGTLIKNLALIEEAHRQYWQKQGFSFTSDEFRNHFVGRGIAEIFKYLAGREPTPLELRRHSGEINSLYENNLTEGVETTTGALEFLNNLKARKLKIALATSAMPENRNLVLKMHGLEPFFDLILGSEQIPKSKPSPDIYLETAARLDVNPEHCLVFEDSTVGIQAAKAAGMKVVGILSSHSAEELQGADFLTKDFTLLELIG